MWQIEKISLKGINAKRDFREELRSQPQDLPKHWALS